MLEHFLGDLVRYEMNGVESAEPLVIVDGFTTAQRASGRVGDASLSNFRTWAETFPTFSDRIFWTEGRPVSGIFKWSKCRLRISPLVHCWPLSGVVSIAVFAKLAGVTGVTTKWLSVALVVEVIAVKFCANFMTEPLRVMTWFGTSKDCSFDIVLPPLGTDRNLLTRGVSFSIGVPEQGKRVKKASLNKVTMLSFKTAKQI